jgi:signal transduction histidine kinase
MKNLIQTIVEEKKIRENNEDKNIRFICNLTGNDSIVVKADMTRLGRVISNLLNNSIESIAESGWIEISLTPAGQNAIRLDVKDSGIGIDHGLLEKLLSGEAITTKGTQGHGLGLSSSIAFIRNDCKGQFDIRSKKNAGTWVSILLPTF